MSDSFFAPLVTVWHWMSTFQVSIGGFNFSFMELVIYFIVASNLLFLLRVLVFDR